MSYTATFSSTDSNSNAYTMNSFTVSSIYTTTNNYYAQINKSVYTVNTSIATFTNNHIGLGGGGDSTGIATSNGGHGIIVNSGITITNLYNLKALLGGGAGGEQYGSGQGGPGGGGGGGGIGSYVPAGYTTTAYVGGGNGGSLLSSSQLASIVYPSNPAFAGYGGAGGGPGQAGETSYPGKRNVGNGGGNGINYGGYFNNATNGTEYFQGHNSGGGGYGGGNSIKFGFRYGGGGGGGGYITNVNDFGRGGYSIYNTGTITNLYNVQGGQNIYGPLFYGGTLPTNYYIRLNTINNYGQLYCIGWSWPTIPNGNSMNIFIDPASTHNSGSATIYLNVFSGFTFTTLPSGSISLNGTLYFWNVQLQTTNVYRLYIHTTAFSETVKNTSAIISPAFSSGIYRHIAMTISGNTHTLYLDGSAVAINTNAGNLFSTYSSISQLFIGSAANLTLGYTGLIDDFKIWNRALPPSDISSIYYNEPSIVKYIQGFARYVWLDAISSSNFTFSTSNNISIWNGIFRGVSTSNITATWMNSLPYNYVSFTPSTFNFQLANYYQNTPTETLFFVLSTPDANISTNYNINLIGGGDGNSLNYGRAVAITYTSYPKPSTDLNNSYIYIAASNTDLDNGYYASFTPKLQANTKYLISITVNYSSTSSTSNAIIRLNKQTLTTVSQTKNLFASNYTDALNNGIKSHIGYVYPPYAGGINPIYFYEIIGINNCFMPLEYMQYIENYLYSKWF